MSEHTQTPWMTNPAGEMLPDDWMIVADMGKTPNGIQQISTVARALSIRQTPETTAANAAFIVRAVNAHEQLVAALEWYAKDYDYATGCSQWDGGAKARAALSNLKETKS